MANFSLASDLFSLASGLFFVNEWNPVVQLLHVLEPFANVAGGLKSILGAF
ncbi:hypothetical protein [Corynebacterium sp. TAE3-ERU16]|uniref:hypothetical protein n=1 Tax=Corynebacterium sp. TAE3-ERU16 TaxID=2849493 RepID=UPI001C490AA8|nr:hypothetical protein [Corynebacterium sp. TAE3-ERU16]MBV7294109.1 hypothetical protein [Corynebacterium sp. TAE3-ERU16]